MVIAWSKKGAGDCSFFFIKLIWIIQLFVIPLYPNVTTMKIHTKKFELELIFSNLTQSQVLEMLDELNTVKEEIENSLNSLSLEDIEYNISVLKEALSLYDDKTFERFMVLGSPMVICLN